MRLALSRLPKEALVAREQRLKRAMDLSMKHKFVCALACRLLAVTTGRLDLGWSPMLSQQTFLD